MSRLSMMAALLAMAAVQSTEKYKPGATTSDRMRPIYPTPEEAAEQAREAIREDNERAARAAAEAAPYRAQRMARNAAKLATGHWATTTKANP